MCISPTALHSIWIFVHKYNIDIQHYVSKVIDMFYNFYFVMMEGVYTGTCISSVHSVSEVGRQVMPYVEVSQDRGGDCHCSASANLPCVCFAEAANNIFGDKSKHFRNRNEKFKDL